MQLSECVSELLLWPIRCFGAAGVRSHSGGDGSPPQTRPRRPLASALQEAPEREALLEELTLCQCSGPPIVLKSWMKPQCYGCSCLASDYSMSHFGFEFSLETTVQAESGW
ncbi:unnamed protein product [Gadus morhua 'NCC']